LTGFIIILTVKKHNAYAFSYCKSDLHSVPALYIKTFQVFLKCPSFSIIQSFAWRQ